MTAQGTLATETIVAGNDIAARQFTFSVNSTPADISSARFSARRSSRIKTHLLELDCDVSGATVTRPVIDAETTATWPELVNWDIELTLASGVVKTWVRGSFTLLDTEQPLDE
jgi:hypothetical protein